MEDGSNGGGGARRASSAADFFQRRHSSSFFQSMRRYSTNNVFGITKTAVDGEGKGGEGKNGTKKGLGGRRHSAAVAQQRGGLLASPRSSSPRSEKWRSLARVVLGNVEEGGEPVVRQDETGDG